MIFGLKTKEWFTLVALPFVLGCAIGIGGVYWEGIRAEWLPDTKNCLCDNWKNCAYEDPQKCSCCMDRGGCKPPVGNPSACCHK